MRLEPVSKRTPQHARGGARRATFHHIVLAVKKIRGIARIKGHGRESRKRRKLRPRPLPPVPHKIMHAECACTGGKRSRRQTIPRYYIQNSPAPASLFFPPRLAAL